MPLISLSIGSVDSPCLVLSSRNETTARARKQASKQAVTYNTVTLTHFRGRCLYLLLHVKDKGHTCFSACVSQPLSPVSVSSLPSSSASSRSLQCTCNHKPMFAHHCALHCDKRDERRRERKREREKAQVPMHIEMEMQLE